MSMWNVCISVCCKRKQDSQSNNPQPKSRTMNNLTVPGGVQDDPNSVTLTDMRIFKRVGKNYVLSTTNIEISNLVVQTVLPAPSNPKEEQKLHPTKMKNLQSFISVETEVSVTDKKNIKIPIYESPLYISKVVKKKFSIPEWTQARHIYKGGGQLCDVKAIEIAKRRNPNVGKTTVFADPPEFWLCDSKEKYGEIQVVVSTKPVRTYQCLHEGGKWIAHFLGTFHVVLTDEGNQFPGYLIRNVFFPQQH